VRKKWKHTSRAAITPRKKQLTFFIWRYSRISQLHWKFGFIKHSANSSNWWKGIGLISDDAQSNLPKHNKKVKGNVLHSSWMIERKRCWNLEETSRRRHTANIRLMTPRNRGLDKINKMQDFPSVYSCIFQCDKVIQLKTHNGQKP
jgi:hypothetical protein